MLEYFILKKEMQMKCEGSEFQAMFSLQQKEHSETLTLLPVSIYLAQLLPCWCDHISSVYEFFRKVMKWFKVVFIILPNDWAMSLLNRDVLWSFKRLYFLYCKSFFAYVQMKCTMTASLWGCFLIFKWKFSLPSRVVIKIINNVFKSPNIVHETQ